MKRKFIKIAVIYTSAFLSVTMISSCNKDNESFSNENNTSVSQTEGVIRIIEELENPYSVNNMRKAYASLQQEGLLKAGINIKPTHLYVRFLPKDSAENEILLTDTSLTLFPYPLDCKLTEGDMFIDPTLKGRTQFTWLYTKVPVGYVSPISGYEIIEELFLLDNNDDNDTQLKSMSISFLDWDLLENRSLQLTGNVNEDLEETPKLKAKIIPMAIIRLRDDVRKIDIPLEGVIVRARNWFNWEEAKTTAQGVITIPEVFNNVDYSIVWEGSDWDIRDGNYGQAILKGPNESTSHWILVIQPQDKSYLYANIHRACWDYWHNTVGLKVPYKDSFWKQKIKIGGFNENGRSFMNPSWRFVLGSVVHIYRNTAEGTVINCAYIYQTTLHELAHISHWDMGWSGVEDKVIESWAIGVAYHLGTRVYSKNNLDWSDMQHVTFDRMKGDLEGKYTPLVIDLMDTENQRATRGGSSNYPIDRVSGYTIVQIEKALKNAKNLTQWCQNVATQKAISNADRNLLQELFNNYINM